MTNSRDIEHANSQGKGLARESSRAKQSSAPCRVHPGMVDRTSDTVGAAPTGKPADAVDPSLYSTAQAGKSFPTPGVTRGMEGHKNDPKRGSYDPGTGAGVMDDAHDAAEPDHPVNMQKRLAASLPSQTNEETSP